VGNLLPTLLFILLTQPLFADYQAGLNEYNAGNYKTARYEWTAVIATPPGKVSPATYAETNYAIGMLYWMGQGVPASYSDAAKWLNNAAELNHAGAQAKLGYLFTQGLTVPQNYETAFEWFSKAAKQGDIDGQYNLGIFYLNGWGTEQNKTMAAQFPTAIQPPRNVWIRKFGKIQELINSHSN
jgi:TPR repeat protein